jgi:LmbE family N-acetylglucosaminyl deacetylase
MRNTADNAAAGSFWTADIDKAARRLAAVLVEENAEVLTIYDEHGTYGHPDHIQVHRVGVRAAQLAGTPYVFEATLNRDRLARLPHNPTSPRDVPPRPDVDGIDDSIGLPENDLTTAIDVSDVLDIKRAAIAAHASQVAEGSFFLELPPTAFHLAFGTEWYHQRETATSRPRRRHLLVE